MTFFIPELIVGMAVLVVFQLKHFVADYPLQTPYMLAKFQELGWVKPLAAHCLVHAVLTGGILLILAIPLWLIVSLMAFDFTVHFVMDRIKASPKMLGRYNVTEKKFWWSLGFDQMIHHITHYVIIYFVLVYYAGAMTS